MAAREKGGTSRPATNDSARTRPVASKRPTRSVRAMGLTHSRRMRIPTSREMKAFIGFMAMARLHRRQGPGQGGPGQDRSLPYGDASVLAPGALGRSSGLDAAHQPDR